MRRESLNALLIALGILAAAFGLKGFLLSSNFIDGGVTGVSMRLTKVTTLPLSVWLPLVNAPFIALGYRQMGRAFAIRSALAIAGTSARRRGRRRGQARGDARGRPEVRRYKRLSIRRSGTSHISATVM